MHYIVVTRSGEYRHDLDGLPGWMEIEVGLNQGTLQIAAHGTEPGPPEPIEPVQRPPTEFGYHEPFPVGNQQGRWVTTVLACYGAGEWIRAYRVGDESA